MTGHGDLETAVDVMRSRLDFVTKLFSTPDLMKKIETALAETGEQARDRGTKNSLPHRATHRQRK